MFMLKGSPIFRPDRNLDEAVRRDSVQTCAQPGTDWTSSTVRKSTFVTKRTARRKSRNGIATVELALVLPVMLILVLGTIEVCHRIFLRQSSLLVAYEGARLAARSITSSQDVIARCNTMLEQRRVVGGTVQVIPENLLALAPGELFTIRVTVPWANNSPTRFVLRDQGTVSVDVHMLRE